MGSVSDNLDPWLASLAGFRFLDASTFAADRPHSSSNFVSGRLVPDRVHRDAEELKRGYLRAVERMPRRP